MSESLKSSLPCLPWSVKGISAQARQTAKEEAAKAGQTIGAWLSAAIRDAADDGELLHHFLGQDHATPKAANSSDQDSAVLQYLQKMDAKLNDMGERLQHLEQSDIDTAVAEISAVAFGLGNRSPQS